MKLIKRILLISALSFAVLLSACRQDSSEPRALRDFAEAVCACEDQECAEQELGAFIEHVDGLRGKEADRTEIQEAAEDVVVCYQDNRGSPAMLIELAEAVR